MTSKPRVRINEITTEIGSDSDEAVIENDFINILEQIASNDADAIYENKKLINFVHTKLRRDLT